MERRELVVVAPGYTGPQVEFLTIADAWAAFPPAKYRDVATKARAWLTPGVPGEVYGKPEAVHVLVVVGA